jgi:hypothetical protein
LAGFQVATYGRFWVATEEEEPRFRYSEWKKLVNPELDQVLRSHTKNISSRHNFGDRFS